MENKNNFKEIIEKIKYIAQKGDMSGCLEHDCDCTNCYDDVTEYGTRCMEFALKKIISECDKYLDVLEKEYYYFVYNPNKDKPKKKYNNYNDALRDAISIALLEKEKIYVLKIIKEITKDNVIKVFY